MVYEDRNPGDYITPLVIDGLEGRVLHLPAPKKYKDTEVLLIYGHHSDLERWWGLAQVINRYGAVTMPDLPGFGGMTPLSKIGMKPSLDNIADYLASFVKMRYKRKRFVIVGISFGFLVATRMLQRNPELIKKVEFLVSAAGFAHHDDFLFTPRRHRIYTRGSRIIRLPVVSTVFRYTALLPPVLRLAYGRTHNAKHKFHGVDEVRFKKLMDREIELWHNNETRTHWHTTVEMLTVDNCQVKVDLPVWHVYSPHDNYFNNDVVEQHYRVIFSDYNKVAVPTLRHVPNVLATAEESEVLVPPKLRQAFLKSKQR